MQITKEKKNDKMFRMTLNPRLVQNSGAFVSFDGSFWNGVYNLNLNSIMKEEDLSRPYNVYVLIQSTHNDAIFTQIQATGNVYYSFVFNGMRPNTYTPGNESMPPQCGILTYSSLFNGGQAAIYVDTTPEKNKPFYVPSLVGVNQLTTLFFDINNTYVDFGNPIVTIQLIFEAADYISSG